MTASRKESKADPTFEINAAKPEIRAGSGFLLSSRTFRKIFSTPEPMSPSKMANPTGKVHIAHVFVE
jgi:hypothetical protein